MNRRNESTLKVIQHEMHHAGKMKLKTSSTEFMGIFCRAALCLFTAVVYTQWTQFGVEIPGPNAWASLEAVGTHITVSSFPRRGVTARAQYICVLFHGASENKEACQPIHKEKGIMVSSYPHSQWVWIQLWLRKCQNLSWPYVKSGHKPESEHSGYRVGMGRFRINDAWKSKAGCVILVVQMKATRTLRTMSWGPEYLL